MVKIDELMIVSRIESPPYEHSTEILYQGELIEVSDISKKFNFTDASKNYFYTIYRIKIVNESLNILSESYIYDNSLKRDSNRGQNSITVPLTKVLGKGLLDLIERVK